MDRVIANLEATSPGGRNSALNGAAWTLGRWIAAGALEQHSAEDAMDANPEHIGLVADDGQRQCWATIRSGLSWMQTPSHTGKHNADGAASVLRVCHLG